MHYYPASKERDASLNFDPDLNSVVAPLDFGVPLLESHARVRVALYPHD